MQTWDALAVELLKFGFRKILYIEVECSRCGAWRIGISPDSILGERFECPKCHRAVPCSAALAIGYTRRELPIVDFWKRPARWDWISLEDHVARSRRGAGGRAHH